MTTMMEWIRDALREHPELALFLALAVGYLLGRLRIGSFKLSPVIGCLLAGVAVGQLGIVIPNALSTAFFLSFLFSLGYESGPQFFRGFGRSALPQVVLVVLFAVSGLLVTYGIARAVGFDAGTAAGLLGGGLNSSQSVGTASSAIEKLAISNDARNALMGNLTVAYAVTYLIGTFVSIFMLVWVGPWLMRVDLRAECQKLEKELGMKKEDVGIISAYKQFVMRAYRVPDSKYKTVADLEESFSPERVFVERVKDQRGMVDASPDLPLEAGDHIVLSGRPKVVAGSGNPLHRYEIDDPALLDVPAIAVDYVLERKDLLDRTLAQIAETLEREIATRGVYVRKVLRAGEELPLGSEVVLERGDVLTLIGAKRHVDRVAARLGPVLRQSNATDIVLLCGAIAIGGLIGLPALNLGRISIGLGVPIGVLLSSLVLGWLNAVKPGFGRVPEPVIWLFDSLGLSAFVTSIGINAGPSFVHGVRSTGLVLLITSIVVCALPFLITMLVGRYLFRLHPGVLLGICAGSGTNSPGLAALQEKAESRVPVLGYGLTYALSALIFAFLGSVIVALVHKS